MYLLKAAWMDFMFKKKEEPYIDCEPLFLRSPHRAETCEAPLPLLYHNLKPRILSWRP